MSGEPVNDPRLLLLDLVHLLLLAEYPVGSVSELTQAIICNHVALLVEGFFDFLRKLFTQLVLNSDNLILDVACGLSVVIVEDAAYDLTDVLLEVQVESTLTLLHLVSELVVVGLQHSLFYLLASHA